jgi:plasmid replication initiation protein
MQKLIPLPKQIVMLSNELVDSNFDLATSELAIILCILGKEPQTKPLDADTWYTVGVKEYMELRKVGYNSAKSALKEASLHLYDRTLKLIDPETGKQEWYRWIIALRPLDNSCELSIKWNPILIPYICELNAYIAMDLLSIASIKHNMAYKLYFLLLRNGFKQHTGEVEYYVDEFVARMGYEDTCYATYSTLKNKLLIPACKELGEKQLLDIKIVETMRRTRTVVKFKLQWKRLANDRGYKQAEIAKIKKG